MNDRRILKQAITSLNKTKKLFKSQNIEAAIIDLDNELFKHPAQDTNKISKNTDQSAADDYLDYLDSQY
jgi:hypothetical protein